MEIFLSMKKKIYCHENNFVKVFSGMCKVLFYNLKSIGLLGLKVTIRILFFCLIHVYVVIAVLYLCVYVHIITSFILLILSLFFAKFRLSKKYFGFSMFSIIFAF